MQPKLLVCAIAASAVFFISGMAVGQRTSASKFDKYLRPVNRPDIDFIALEVNVESIRESVPMDNGISIPQVYFNYKKDRPQASVSISPEFEKASLDAIKSQIIEKYYMAYLRLKDFIPTLSEDDFVLRVIRITPDPDHKIFAECRHGDIVFH